MLDSTLTQEINGTGPKVIPLLLNNCKIPTILADKLYISIDEHGSGIREIIPAIFHDSYILDVILNADNLTCENLQEELYEYTRSTFTGLHVRIENHGFNRKVNSIVEQAVSISGTPQPVIDQIINNNNSGYGFGIGFPGKNMPNLFFEISFHFVHNKHPVT